MADTKISSLGAITSLLATDEFVVARSGTTKKIAAANLRSAVRAVRAATQSISNSTETPIQFNEADSYDTDGFHDPASNNTRLTIPTGMGGLYLLLGDTAWQTHTTGDRFMYIKKNGTDYIATMGVRAAGTFGTTTQIMYLGQLAAGDYVELPIYHNAGTSLTVATSSFSAVRL